METGLQPESKAQQEAQTAAIPKQAA